MDAVALSDVEEAVHAAIAPSRASTLVPAVACVPRSRHVDVDVRDLGSAPAEVANILPVLAARLLQYLPREPALEREPGGLIADVLDVGVEARRVHAEPPFGRIGGGDPVGVLGQPSDRAVVDHLAFFVAPRRIEDLVDLEPGDVSGHHAVEQASGVGPTNDVLVQRRDVDDPCRLADRVVFDVVEVGVDGRAVVARPFTPCEMCVQLGLSRVEHGADAHRGPSVIRLASVADAGWASSRGVLTSGQPLMRAGGR